MNGVMIIPTGLGCEIGGHAGDANPVAKLVASVCDTLAIHPNVVNASDINEMTNNMLYVEGSMLDRFLEGSIKLNRVNNNKILVVANSPLNPNVINSVSAARATIGIDASILVLKTPLRMIGKIKNNQATGEVYGWKELVNQVKNYNFDALAIASPIEVERDTTLNYFKEGGVNPWGGIEAITSRLISDALNKPVAHSPVCDIAPSDEELYDFQYIVDPRIASEVVSVSYLHCILKGLHKAPVIGNNFSVKDIDFLISPFGCWGRPHLACTKANIPIIVVEENKTCFDLVSDKAIYVKNYLEAIGVIKALKIGVTIESVTRPISYTKIKENNEL